MSDDHAAREPDYEYETDVVLAELAADDALAFSSLLPHAAAINAGHVHYRGERCGRGHDGKRYTKNRVCVTCELERQDAPRREERPRTSWLFSIGWRMSPSWRAKVEAMAARAAALVDGYRDKLYENGDRWRAVDADRAQAQADAIKACDANPSCVFAQQALYEAMNEPRATCRRLHRALRALHRYTEELQADDALIAKQESDAVTAEIAALMQIAIAPSPPPKPRLVWSQSTSTWIAANATIAPVSAKDTNCDPDPPSTTETAAHGRARSPRTSASTPQSTHRAPGTPRRVLARRSTGAPRVAGNGLERLRASLGA